jgi:hypothetical protein
MCLSKIEAVIDQPSDLIVDGWKEFDGSKPALSFTNFGGVLKMDTWLVASEVQPPMNITASDGKTYKAGFHAYAEEGAWRRAPRRVYLRKITCIGEQDNKKVVVAEELYVPTDPNGWPPQPPAAPLPPPKTTLKDRVRKKLQ